MPHTPLVKGTTLRPHVVLPQKEFTPFFFSFTPAVSHNKTLLDCGWSLCTGKMVDEVKEGTMKAVASYFKWSKQNM